MRARLTCLASATLLSVLCSLSLRAHAQAWLSDRGGNEGIGIRAGNLEIHPGVSAEVGYDSNVFLRPTSPQGSAILRMTPHIFLSTLGGERMQDEGAPAAPPKVEFRGGASMPMYYYLSTDQGFGAEGNVDLALRLLPQRVVSFGAMGRYRRTFRPFANGPANANYGRNTIDVGPQLKFQTTGGVLQASVGGNFNYSFFDDADYDDYDNKAYRAEISAAWMFLPKTALVYDAEFEYRDAENAAAGAELAGPLRVDSNRYQFRLGVNGALTGRISASLLVGYTAMYFQGPAVAGADTDSPTLLTQLTWRLSDTAKAVLGYDLSTSAAYQGNYQLTQRASAATDLLIGGTFLLGAKVSYARMGYGIDRAAGGSDQNATDGKRTDNRVEADVHGEYRLADWIAMTASTGMLLNSTDFKQRVQEVDAMGNPLPVPTVLPVNFTRFDAFLGMRIFY